METKIRRLQNNLVTIGTGIIVFSVWSIIKTVFSTTLFRAEMLEDPGEYDLVVIALTWIITLVDCLLHCFIGFSARAEGNGKRKSVFYLIVTGLVLCLYIPLVAAECTTLFHITESVLKFLFTLFIDITSVVMMAELFVSAVSIRVLKRCRKRREAQA